MRTADFHYHLPPSCIAQSPSPQRDTSRLLVLHRVFKTLQHHAFGDLLNLLSPGDLLVLNDSRVIPARLRARKDPGGALIEILLTRPNSPIDWLVLLRPAKRVPRGTRLRILDESGSESAVTAVLLEKSSDGICRLVFEGIENLRQQLERLGEVPLPPYIRRNGSRPSAEDRERYQNVYARSDGSVAAPTAGLHFTPELLDRLRARGIETCFVTLHVGLGTFAPVKSEDLQAHNLHAEHFEVSSASAQTINNARAAGRRIVAVGTTTARTLEHLAAQSGGSIIAGVGTTNLFIHPPFDFRVVGALVTNFHLPRSTLLMLVSAFAAPGSLTGRATLMHAYTAAVESGYRFYSYGDSMLIL